MNLTVRRDVDLNFLAGEDLMLCNWYFYTKSVPATFATGTRFFTSTFKKCLSGEGECGAPVCDGSGFQGCRNVDKALVARASEEKCGIAFCSDERSVYQHVNPGKNL